MQTTLVVIHVLAATVWAGGHLVLATRFLPLALAEKDPAKVLFFESRYEGIGIPALLIQVVSGFWLAWRRLADAAGVLHLDSKVAALVGVKLVLLVVTVILAFQARFRHIPELNAERLPALARHIFAVTGLAVGFVVVGVLLRLADG